MSDTKKTVLYRGPGLHERVITKEQLVEALEIPEEEFPKDFERFFWGANPGRKSVSLEGMPEQVIELLSDDPSMEIKEDGKVTSPAVPDADHVFPDGSSAGVDGNPELQGEVTGFSEAQSRVVTSGRGSSVGGSTTGDSTSTSTGPSVGGSTAGI